MNDDTYMSDIDKKTIKPIYRTSGKLRFKKHKNDYILVGNVIINKSYDDALNELKERKKSLGVVYGEFKVNETFDTSLSKVSHIISNIKKIDIVEYNSISIEFSCRILNTHWGKELKEIIDDGLMDDLRFFMRYVDYKDQKKIFTIDIDFLSNNLKILRREKLIELNK